MADSNACVWLTATRVCGWQQHVCVADSNAPPFFSTGGRQAQVEAVYGLVQRQRMQCLSRPNRPDQVKESRVFQVRPFMHVLTACCLCQSYAVSVARWGQGAPNVPGARSCLVGVGMDRLC